MNKNIKLILAVLLVLLAVFGMIWLFLNFSKLNVKKEIGLFPENPAKGDYGYQETETLITIGTEGVSKGTFDSVEEGVINFVSGSEIVKYPLTEDEVILSCTTQNLALANELDFDLVTNVIISTPTDIGGLIPTEEYIVVFAQDVEGVMRVHTVAIDASKCPSTN